MDSKAKINKLERFIFLNTVNKIYIKKGKISLQGTNCGDFMTSSLITFNEIATIKGIRVNELGDDDKMEMEAGNPPEFVCLKPQIQEKVADKLKNSFVAVGVADGTRKIPEHLYYIDDLSGNALGFTSKKTEARLFDNIEDIENFLATVWGRKKYHLGDSPYMLIAFEDEWTLEMAKQEMSTH